MSEKLLRFFVIPKRVWEVFPRGIGTISKSVGGFLLSVGVTYEIIGVTFKRVRGTSKSIGGFQELRMYL